jgi:protein-tyrosine-phosphatase
MAVGLARKLCANPTIRIESAGLDADEGVGATGNAIAVMEELGIDIANHRARDVRSVALEQFTHIVAMNGDIEEQLSERFRLNRADIITLEVDDPFGRGIDVYRDRATMIRITLLEWFQSAPAAPVILPEHGDNEAPHTDTTLAELVEYTAKAEERLAAGKLTGSHLHGVMGTVYTKFEVLLRETFKAHIVTRGMTYEVDVQPRLKKKIDDLTLGQTIEGLRIVDERSGSGSKLLTKATNKRLEIVSGIRRDAQHRAERITALDQHARAKRLFVTVGELLKGPIFSSSEQ